MPSPIAVHYRQAGWLVRSATSAVVAYRFGEGEHVAEAALKQVHRPVLDLYLFPWRDGIELEILDALKRAVAGRLELGVTSIRLVIEKVEDQDVQLVLKQLDRAPRDLIFDPLRARHEQVSFVERVAARAKRAGSESINTDVLSTKGAAA